MAGNLTGHHGFDVFGLNDGLLEVIMSVGLMRYDKASPHLNRGSPQHEGGCHGTSVPNPAGSDDWDINGIHHLWDQGHGGQFADVAPCFHTFDHHCFGADAFHTFGQGHRRYYWNQANARFFEALHILTWVTCTSGNDFDARCD